MQRLEETGSGWPLWRTYFRQFEKLFSGLRYLLGALIQAQRKHSFLKWFIQKDVQRLFVSVRKRTKNGVPTRFLSLATSHTTRKSIHLLGCQPFYIRPLGPSVCYQSCCAVMGCVHFGNWQFNTHTDVLHRSVDCKDKSDTRRILSAGPGLFVQCHTPGPHHLRIKQTSLFRMFGPCSCGSFASVNAALFSARTLCSFHEISGFVACVRCRL